MGRSGARRPGDVEGFFLAGLPKRLAWIGPRDVFVIQRSQRHKLFLGLG